MISPCAMLITPMRPKVIANPSAATSSTAERLKPRNAVPKMLPHQMWFSIA